METLLMIINSLIVVNISLVSGLWLFMQYCKKYRDRGDN